MASPPNPTTIPVVTYEYLFCLPSSKRPQSAARRKARGLLSGLVPWVPWPTSYGPTNLDTTLFPPAANDWGTKGPIPDMVSPPLAKGEGPQT
jgi:hypothetical protein